MLPFRAFTLAIAVAVAVAFTGCARGPTSFAPDAPRPPVCPMEGCGDGGASAIGTSHALDACLAGEAACTAASPHECTERALANWAQAEDDHPIACIARLLTSACSLGDPVACGYAGRMWIDGRAVASDPERGVAMLAQACEGGVALACMVALRWLADGSHAQLVKDGANLRSRLDTENSCVSGSGDACTELGIAFYNGKDPYPRDLARAAIEYERGCNLGSGLACNNLGDAYEYGQSVPRDLARAAGLYERACHGGRPIGCANLAHLLEHGEGTAQDLPRARSLYRGACSAGDVYGCLHAQLLTAEDAGAPREPARSVAHWQRACDAGDARACTFVGLIFEDGPDGLSRDEARSGKAMARACDLGNRYGCAWQQAHGGP